MSAPGYFRYLDGSLIMDEIPSPFHQRPELAIEVLCEGNNRIFL